MDKRKVFRELVSAEEAIEIFTNNMDTEVMATEKVELHSALGRVLAKSIFSPINVPPFDRASMDGFAVISSDLYMAEENQPVTLNLIGKVAAGYVFDGVGETGTAVEVSTGAPMPIGYDSVVMVEYTDLEQEKVNIYRQTTPGENIMAAGTDIQEGERVLSAHTRLSSRELAILASMGYDEVEVIRKPSIGIFSSGDEIIPIGEPLKPGKLYDINSTAIYSSIIENGGAPTYLGIIKDNYDSIYESLKGAMEGYDMVLISGGTSAGMGDMLYEVVDKLGKPGLLVHGVKVKPGKPTILSVCDGVPIVGLPGYPASALSILRLFVLPLIRKRAGLPPLDEDAGVTAIVKQKIRSVNGRHEFKPMNLIKSDNGWIAVPVPGGSGAITSIALADGFVEIPDDTSFISQNTEVKVSLFSSKIIPPSIQIIGSHCIALAKLQQLLSQEYPEISSRSIIAGSTGGVAAIRRKEAHIAGIHILTEDGKYNSGIEEKADAKLVKGYARMQGLIVKKGNPKGINSIEDILKENIRFINRNPGSGTRILFDDLLDTQGIDPSSINGYNQYTKSHSSAAMAVLSPQIDVAMGIQSVVSKDHDFIPLKEEEYDFLIGNHYFDNPAVQAFLKVLRSDGFKSIIENLEGYSLVTT